jgi:acetyl esterase/lipase
MFSSHHIVYFSPQIEDTLIENVPVRIARPLNNNGNLPAIVFFHGGAFYMGSVGEFDLYYIYKQIF